MAKIDSAYDYYVSTYGNQKTSRYDSHKKSDLRKIYNSIVKSNKESPLYKIADVEGAKRYAIDIKENAKAIQNVVASLTDNPESMESAFQKKVAVSSNEDAVDVTYLGTNGSSKQVDSFTISVNHLASPQVNTGNFLKDKEASFPAGNYSFDLTTNNAAYEFQYSVSSGETNSSVLSKLGNLVNSSNLGIKADILHRAGEESALSLTSKQTGLSDNETALFAIAPSGGTASRAAMDILGIHRITSPATNSDFTLNGKPQASLSNTFTINNSFELTLKAPTGEDAPVTIGFKGNADAVADNIQSLLDAYNGMIKTAESYDKSGSYEGRRLLNEMGSITKNRKDDFEQIGLMVADNGSISIDKERLSDALTPDRIDDTLDMLNYFRDTTSAKASSASIDPMKFVDKVIVEYKNPGRNFAAPYVSSIYSGLMLDDYI